MLSDAPRNRNLPSGRKRLKDATTNKAYSDSQKIEAVTTYLALGNLALTASVLKINELTMREWKQKQWWKDLEQELAVQEDIQLSSRLQKIIDSTLTATEDRIRNGDWIFNNKEGCLIRKPVNLRDVHKVSMDMLDKREHILNKQPTTVAMEQIDDRLRKLAEKFEQMARPQIQVTDVIMVTGEADGSNPTIPT